LPYASKKAIASFKPSLLSIMLGKVMKIRKRNLSCLIKRHQLIAVIALILITVAVITFSQLTFLKEHKPRAAIIDSLYLLIPNEEFLLQTEQILQEAGFEVREFIGENVTVRLFKELPSMNFDLIIFRVHSAYVCFTEKGEALVSVYFFTGEEFNASKYVEEQLLGEVVIGWVKVNEEMKKFFAVTPRLILNSKGSFDGTVILVDSCYGLNNTYMAKAFIKKGANIYIGWDREVSFLYADNVTLSLLKHLVIDHLKLEDAVNLTIQECGKDPLYKNSLLYYTR